MEDSDNSQWTTEMRNIDYAGIRIQDHLRNLRKFTEILDDWVFDSQKPELAYKYESVDVRFIKAVEIEARNARAIFDSIQTEFNILCATLSDKVCLEYFPDRYMPGIGTGESWCKELVQVDQATEDIPLDEELPTTEIQTQDF